MKTVILTLFLQTVAVFWNVENFFDWKSETSNPSEQAFSSFGKNRWTRGRFEKKAFDVAKVLMLIGEQEGRMPDYVALAEIENKRVLYYLTRETPLSKFGYGFLHFDSDDSRGIDLAILYHTERPEADSVFFKGTRSFLVAKGDSLSLVAVHLPSKLGAQKARQRREAMMRRLSSLATTLEGPVLVMGDFNDTRCARSDSLMLPLREIVSSAGAPGSLKFQGQWETIDRVFYLGKSEGVSVRIFSNPYILEQDRKYGGDKPRRTYSGPVYNGGISDHLPIVVRIPRDD